MVGQPSDTFCIFYVFYCILLYFICIFYILLISFIFFDVALMRDTMPAHNNTEQQGATYCFHRILVTALPRAGWRKPTQIRPQLGSAKCI